MFPGNEAFQRDFRSAMTSKKLLQVKIGELCI